MSAHGTAALIRAFEINAAAGNAQILATVIRARGSTYRKPGARMLITADGSVTGIVGGGCFDTDLIEQARSVFESSQPRTVVYDMRSPDEAIWGLGLGCEGEVTLFLQRLQGRGNPMECLRTLFERDTPGRIATLLSPAGDYPAGYSWIAGEGDEPVALPDNLTGHADLETRDDPIAVFVDGFQPPPRLLICGAGVDAVPLASQAIQLGWRVTVLDHRPGHVRADRFPKEVEVREFDGRSTGPMQLADAAVVMSHNLEADREYLRALAKTDIGYVGVLGPAARRRRLLEELGHENLPTLLRGPVGLNLGGELPEEIALSITAEIQSFFRDADALPLTPRQ